MFHNSMLDSYLNIAPKFDSKGSILSSVAYVSESWYTLLVVSIYSNELLN